MSSASRCEFDGDALTVRHEIRLPGHVSAITPAVDAVMAVVREMGCAGADETDVELALREALANAVRHGARNDPSREVHCCVACDPERGMLIVVSDNGDGFDPNALPSPLQAENLYETHGRGIYLINRLMDEVRFEKGGTEIHMLKRPRRADG